VLIGFEFALFANTVVESAESLGEFEVDLGGGFTEGDGLLEFVPGWLPLSQEDEGDAKVVVEVVVIWLECEGLFEMGAGVGVISVGALDNSVKVKDLRIMGAQCEQFGTEGTCIVDVAAGDLRTVELELAIGVAGVIGESLAKELDGVLIAVLVGEDGGKRQGQGQGFWGEFEASRKGLTGLIGVVEKSVGTSEVESEGFCAGRGVEECDYGSVVLA
jgi:hypothetical protein